MELEKAIESFKRYINSQEQKLDDYYRMDEDFYRDEIEQLELSLKLLRTILNLIEKQQKELNNLKEIEKSHQKENGKLRVELEQYKRLAEMNLKDAEEFKNNMCEHRCILYNEKEELKADLYEANNIISDYIDTTTKKEKMIELMADMITELKPAHFKKEKGGELAGEYRCFNKKEWKQYFEKKAEETNNE